MIGTRLARLVSPVAFLAALAACGGGGSATHAALPNVAENPSGATTAVASGHRTGAALTAREMLASLRTLRSASTVTLPSAVDLTPYMPPVMDQGTQNTCVSFAAAYAMRGYEARRDVFSHVPAGTTNPAYNFSPQFSYQTAGGYNGSPISIGQALSAMQSYGVATLASAPNGVTGPPSSVANAQALKYKLSSYAPIAPNDLTTIKSQLAAGLPVVIALQVDANFMAGAPGKIYTSEAGGALHAVVLTGYDDSTGSFSFQNSWGTGWGDAGRSRIAYSQFGNGIVAEAWSAVDDHGMPPAIANTAGTAANLIASTKLPQTNCVLDSDNFPVCTAQFTSAAPTTTVEFHLTHSEQAYASVASATNALSYANSWPGGLALGGWENTVCLTIMPATAGATVTATVRLELDNSDGGVTVESMKPLISVAACNADALTSFGDIAFDLIPSSWEGNVRAPGSGPGSGTGGTY